MQQAGMVYPKLGLHRLEQLPAKVCSTGHTETEKLYVLTCGCTFTPSGVMYKPTGLTSTPCGTIATPVGVIGMAHGLIERPVKPTWITATACASQSHTLKGCFSA